MKKYTPYVAMTLMAFFAPLTASPIVEKEPGFWSTLFNAMVEGVVEGMKAVAEAIIAKRRVETNFIL